MGKRMVIIGGGIAGLSTGIYALMNGYKPVIYEMHDIPGGLCTAWKRRGYTFDISMHMLVGSSSGPFNQMWQELGVLKDRKFFYHDVAARIEGIGKSLDICADSQRMEEQMLSLSPVDAGLIKEFIRLLFGRSMMGFAPLKPAELFGLMDNIRMFFSFLPLIGVYRKYGHSTMQDFAQRFKDPFLRNAVRFFIDTPGWPMPRFPMFAMTGMMSSSDNAGVPLGGSQDVIFTMAERYKQLGGEIQYKSRATDIITLKDRAIGVRFEDGREILADDIIWAADGHKLIFDILGGRYLSDEIRNMYNDWMPVRPMVHVAIGVGVDLSREPHTIIFELDRPIAIANEEHRWMHFLHHCFDPGMAPKGKSAVEIWYATRYDYWERLAEDRKAYEAEKKRIADFSIAELDRRWPGFASAVEVTDVPTP
ncbi:MAG: NAD(P)/FAD-dependent oxidoreductase, partial [Deltaproteobacteria bacterium]|nr:NAD(P)/FAD-dependent oxidoreductase [Deltaproteobacteria bacterium]